MGRIDLRSAVFPFRIGGKQQPPALPFQQQHQAGVVFQAFHGIHQEAQGVAAHALDQAAEVAAADIRLSQQLGVDLRRLPVGFQSGYDPGHSRPGLLVERAQVDFVQVVRRVEHMETDVGLGEELQLAGGCAGVGVQALPGIQPAAQGVQGRCVGESKRKVLQQVGILAGQVQPLQALEHFPPLFPQGVDLFSRRIARLHGGAHPDAPDVELIEPGQVGVQGRHVVLVGVGNHQ